MYQGDSFHTLSTVGQIGLVVVSLMLSLMLLAGIVLLARHLPVALRLVLALLAFYLFVWLSPQAYYTYYLFLFEGLPWQNVIPAPPDGATLIALFGFFGDATLSAHGQGVLGWLALVAGALAKPLSRCFRRTAAN